MFSIRQRALNREFLAGTWNSLGSSIATEITGKVGYDWVLLDQEHGPGDSMTLLHQLMALKESACAPIVRIAWNDRVLFKRALDLGASGIMVPTVDSAEEARRAVDFMRYPPDGIRGVAGACRAASYSINFKEYASTANQQLTGIMQLETARGVEAADEIAAVDGVDVLFVGPVDLSFSTGKREQFKDTSFVDMLKHVSAAGKTHGKSVGILVPETGLVPVVRDMGFNFVAVSSEQASIVRTLSTNLAAMREQPRH